MIDLHCHFMAGIDDGARTLDESISLLRLAAEQGISRSVLTPHIQPKIYDNRPAEMLPLFEALREEVIRLQLPIEIALAGEVRLSTEILTALPSGDIPFLGRYQNMDVMLLELPDSHIPPGVENLIKWLKKQHVLPLIAHPERNRDVIADPHKALMLKRLGVMFQLTVGSFAGDFGGRVEATAFKLVELDCIDLVASDAHRIDRRPPRVKVGLAVLAEHVGEQRVKEYSQLIPGEISASLFAQGMLTR